MILAYFCTVTSKVSCRQPAASFTVYIFVDEGCTVMLRSVAFPALHLYGLLLGKEAIRVAVSPFFIAR